MKMEATRPDLQKRTALGRSFDVYYRDAARMARMDTLNREFVRKGDLAFDIGAHVGDRTGSFLRLGASVVTVEPQTRVFRALRLLYGQDKNVTLHRTAVGASAGTIDMFVNSDNPTITTASTELIAAAKNSAQWQGQVWDQKVSVPVTTLDHLIKEHGLPAFVKIDVEGFELDVLNGLTTPLPALSFEFTTIQRDIALRCLERLSKLGPYEFSLSFGEDHALVYPDWVDAKRLRKDLLDLPNAANSGDIFARLQGRF